SPRPPLFPYTTLFRSRNPRTDHYHIRRSVPFDFGGLGLLWVQSGRGYGDARPARRHSRLEETSPTDGIRRFRVAAHGPLLNGDRSEEHTSELQSLRHL